MKYKVFSKYSLTRDKYLKPILIIPGPDIPVDDYPVTVTQDNGHQVLIVQASCYTKYLGFITVYFDAENKLHHWEGNPIYLDQKISQNQYVNELMVPWKEVVDQVGKQVLGETKVLLKQTDCSFGDCNIGNFIAEAMVDAVSLHFYTMFFQIVRYSYNNIILLF